MKKINSIKIVTLLILSMFALSVLWSGANAYTFPKSSKVALVPSPSSNNGGTLYTGTSWPLGDSFTFTNVAVADIANGAIANPIAAGGFDTVMLMTPNFDFAASWADSDFSGRILSFVNGGGKLIIYTSETTSATGFAGFVYPFAVDTPGQTGAFGGTLTNLVDDTLSSSNPADASYVNLAMVTSGTDAVGDLTVMASFDSHWYIDMFGINVNNVGGPGHTYAFYGAGLIIFNGLDIDYDYANAPTNANGGGVLSMIWWRELSAQTLGPGPNVNGLTLTPATATNVVGTTHTVTATVRNTVNNNPIPNVVVTFTILAGGPNAGLTGSATTNANGEATFSWSSTTVGTDTVQASIPNSNIGGPAIVSTATKTWVQDKAMAASVWTTGTIGGPAQNQFNLGQTVYIYWNPSPTGSLVDIKVVDQANNVVFGPANNQPESNAPLSFVPPGIGYYSVIVNGQPAFTIAVATFFVVPESMLGTLMATITAFAAFAAMGIIKTKYKKQ